MKQQAEINQQTLVYEKLGADTGVQFVWGHGWGQNRQAMLAMAQALESVGEHYLIDFPGFGDSPRPQETWGSAEYAEYAAAWIETLPAAKKRIWIGHSFGCRVGVRLAAQRYDLLDGLFLIAAAGIPRKRSTWEKLQTKVRVYGYKLIKRIFIAFGISHQKLATRFGSADYRNAGEMRDIFLATIKDNLSTEASRIQRPTILVYGEGDTETPPNVGEQYSQLIPDSELVVLPNQDHYTVLDKGRHQVLAQLKQFVRKVQS